MAPYDVDLLILGSGSMAFAAALRAQELGKTAVMTEEAAIGGTCVNRGCLPSKNLIEAARIVHEARNPRYPGLRPVSMDIDFPALIAQKDGVVRSYRGRLAGGDSVHGFPGRQDEDYRPRSVGSVSGSRPPPPHRDVGRDLLGSGLLHGGRAP